MSLIGILLLVALVVASYVAGHRPTLPAPKTPSSLALDAVAEHLALPPPALGATALSGRVNGFVLRVEGSPDATHIFVDGPERIPDWLRITPVARYERRPDEERAPTGDRYFDSLFAVCGPEREVAALMDESTRATMTRLLGVEVDSGTLHFRTTAHDPRMLRIAVDRVVELATSFADPASRALDRVHTNALADGNPLVRRNLLDLLVKRFLSEPRTRETLTRALEDPFARNAFLAARALGNEAARTYLKRFVIVGERNEERIDAFEELLAHEPWDEIAPLLEAAALGSSREMARRATEWLLEQGTPVVFTRLLDRITPSTPHFDLVVRAAVRASGSELERSLLFLLQRSYGDIHAANVMTVAVYALGRAGTATCLPWLDAIASGHDPAFAAARKGARRSSAAIRRRLRANAGALAVVEGEEAGALSVTVAETGAVSLPE